MDLRPQAHEIIRTWLFSTVLRSHLEFDALPWTDAAISGWVLDPDRKKMSKSKGNVVTPAAPDRAVRRRRRAATGPPAAGPGTDTAVDEGQMKVGRRLAIKLLNASRFALGLGDEADARSPVAARRRSPSRSTGPCSPGWPTWSTRPPPPSRATTTPGPSSAPSRSSGSFCDHYLELVKGRAYGAQGEGRGRSAQAALQLALSTQLRLLAPFLPFVTEEVWSWWQDGSVHRAPWPDAAELRAVAGDGDPLGRSPSAPTCWARSARPRPRPSAS